MESTLPVWGHQNGSHRFLPKREVADFIEMVRRGRREIGLEHPLGRRAGELRELEGLLRFTVRHVRGHVLPRQMGRLAKEIHLIREQLGSPEFRLEGDALPKTENNDV